MTDRDDKFKRLRAADEFKALKMIEANGKLEDGLWTYNPGWSDFKIATDLGYAEGAIARRRTEIFGPLRRVNHGAEAEAKRVDAEIESLKTQAQGFRVDKFRIEQRIEALEKAFNVLMTAPVREGITPERLKALQSHFKNNSP